MSARTLHLALTLLVPFSVPSVAAENAAEEPVVPREVVRLFNGKDLSGFYTWLKETGRDDPQKVFSVADGVIRVSGEGAGYLATNKPYKDYHLVARIQVGQADRRLEVSCATRACCCTASVPTARRAARG